MVRHSRITLMALAVAGLALTGCSSASEVGEVKPVNFTNVDELFAAVDRHLGCPADSSGDYAFDLGAERGLVPGRSCGESIVMAFSENPTVIADIQEDMSTPQGGLVPMAHHDTWFVADISEVTAEKSDLDHPESRNLEGLATALRTNYTEL